MNDQPNPVLRCSTSDRTAGGWRYHWPDGSRSVEFDTAGVAKSWMRLGWIKPDTAGKHFVSKAR